MLWEREGSGLGSLGAASSESPRIGTGSCVTWSSPCVCVGRIGCELVCPCLWVGLVVGLAVCDSVLVPCATVCSSRVPAPPGVFPYSRGDK